MKAQRLTTRFVESVKAPAKGQAAYPDGLVPGLELRVSANGRKTWSLRYRTLKAQQRRMTLGAFPAVDLGDARKAALLALGGIADGEDPAAERRRDKAAEAAREIRTFNDLADAYLTACETGRWRPRNKTKRARTLKEERDTLSLHVRPKLGKRDFREITRRDVRQMLAKMRDAGLVARVVRAHALIRQIYNYAIGEELVEINPGTGFPLQAQQKARERTLTDDELKALWNALEDPSGLKSPDGETVTVGRPMRIALQLCLLLLQRRGEIAGIALSELDLDGDAPTWLLPGARSKNGKPHLIPLPPRAVTLIREAIEISSPVKENSASGETPPTRESNAQPERLHVFPSQHAAGKGFHPDSLTHAMAKLTAALGIKGAAPHDLRRTGSTLLTSERIGVSPFVRSQVLGHTSDAGGGAAVSSAHYDRNLYITDKRRALSAWEDLLLEIVGERPRTPRLAVVKGGRH